MSRTREYSNETIAVIVRFFSAIDTIIAMEKIRGVKTYCERYGIDRRAVTEQRRNTTTCGRFQISWVIPLIKDFDVSPRWILTGEGRMFVSPRMSDVNAL